MTIKISFSDTTVRVAVEINGAIESLITELPQREWVGLTIEEVQEILNDPKYQMKPLIVHAVEDKLKDKNT